MTIDSIGPRVNQAERDSPSTVQSSPSFELYILGKEISVYNRPYLLSVVLYMDVHILPITIKSFKLAADVR